MKIKVGNIILIVLIVAVVIFILYKLLDKKVIINSDNKWYIQVNKDYLNVRETPSAYSKLVGKVKKGQKYEVKEINTEDKAYVWYHIDKGWVSNSWVSHDWVLDFNNPYDVYSPTLKFKKDVYYTHDIDSITYDHLECWDDKEYKLSHQVYIDKNDASKGIQYWIVYTIEDTEGRKVSKTQKIVFDVKPTIELPDISTR